MARSVRGGRQIKGRDVRVLPAPSPEARSARGRVGQGTRWIAAVVLLASACITIEAVAPTQAQLARAQSQGLTPELVESGRDLFKERCTSCHVAPDPASRLPGAWPAEVRYMASRANLTPEQTELIAHYLQTVSEP